MYSINKKSTRKRHIKKVNKTKRKVGKNTKKRTSKKNKQTKRRKKGGKEQTYYWSPMRKLQFNPDLDSTLSDLDRPRMDITDPVYNCKNPVTVIQTNQTGGAYVVGNNEQTIGNAEISTECPYQAQGASSYAYNYPPGLSNGLIMQNNDSQNGGGIHKTTKKDSRKPYKSSSKTIGKHLNPYHNNPDIKNYFEKQVTKCEEKKEKLVASFPGNNEIEELMDKLIKQATIVRDSPTQKNYNNYINESTSIVEQLETLTKQ